MPDPGEEGHLLAARLIEVVPEASYWSNATAPPFDWVLLSTFGLMANSDVEAFGHPE